MKILLVKPRARLGTVLGLQAFQLLEPLELGYLAAAVGPGHEVQVLDLRLVRRGAARLEAVLARLRPDLVGFTAYSHEASRVKKLAAMVRAALPRTHVVVGGHHATVAPADLDVPQVDTIVRGEGCHPFAALVAALDAGEPADGIPGVLQTGQRFDAAAAAVWPRFPDPASLPVPRRDLWDPRCYRSVWASEEMPAWQSVLPPVAMVRSSFGCRQRCSFCIVPLLCGGVHQPRPADAVADEIASLEADHVYFSDDESFIDEAFAADLAEALERRGVRKRYFAWTRSTTVIRSPELLRRWREIGLDAAFLGFEYATDAELRQAHKGGTVAANERALDLMRSMKIAVHAAFMVQPSYTEDDLARLRGYVRSLPPAQCSFTVCTPSPGTADYEALTPQIWVDNPYDLHDCMHPLTPTAVPLRRFAALLARQASEGTARTPLRQHRHPLPPGDIVRLVLAERRYNRGFRRLYRDYPRHLWEVTA
jgi:radical SAM superfamily enzyme YgiQ (UPF0313 family)